MHSLVHGLSTCVPVDHLAKNVGMSGMSSRFFKEVHQDPTKIDRCLIADVPTEFVETRHAATRESVRVHMSR